MDTSAYAPFGSDAEFLDAAILHLEYCAQRLAAQADLKTRLAADDADEGRPGRHSLRDVRCRVHDLEQREQELADADRGPSEGDARRSGASPARDRQAGHRPSAVRRGAADSHRGIDSGYQPFGVRGDLR